MSQENLLFKEEILKTVREFKETLTKNFETKISELTIKNEKLEKILEHLTEDNKKLIDNITSKQFGMEKVTQLENFKNKTDSMLITHEIRINNNIEEIGSLRTKYDRALIDNLLVPGYIGPSCQYKNIGDFIIHNISEISKIKSEREVMKKNFREMRTKTDSVMRTILNLTESLVKRCNDYTNAQISDIKSLIYDKVNAINDKEKEIQESISNFNKEQKNMGLSDKMEELKEDVLSTIDLRFIENKKNIKEYFYGELNKNNSFLENYTKNIIEDKIKEINSDIKELQNKVKNIRFNNNLPLVSPIPKNSIKDENVIVSNSIQNLRKGKTNEFVEVNNNTNNYIPNKTFTNINNMKAMNFKNIIKKNLENKNLEIQKNNNDKSLESILIEEIEKDNKKKKQQKEIPEIVLKHKESKILLLNYNKTQKLKRFSNNLHEIKSGKNLQKKFSIFNNNSPNKKDSQTGNDSANATFIQKNDNNENIENNNNNNNNDIKINNNDNDNNKIVNKEDNEINETDNNIHNIEIINNFENNININNNNKIDNNNNDINNMNMEQNFKTPLIIKKKHLITEENIKNIHKILQEGKNNLNNKNKKINIKDKIIQEKPAQNIIDELKIPKILDQRILSNDELEEIKLNSEKSRSLNKKMNFKIDLNKSVSASYKSIKRNKAYLSPNNKNKTLKNWKKNVIKERNINYNSNGVYNMINLELKHENYTMNGATVLANKKLENNHVTKMEGQSSFNRLFNAQIGKNFFQNNEN